MKKYINNIQIQSWYNYSFYSFHPTQVTYNVLADLVIDIVRTYKSYERSFKINLLSGSF